MRLRKRREQCPGGEDRTAEVEAIRSLTEDVAALTGAISTYDRTVSQAMDMLKAQAEALSLCRSRVQALEDQQNLDARGVYLSTLKDRVTALELGAERARDECTSDVEALTRRISELESWKMGALSD